MAAVPHHAWILEGIATSGWSDFKFVRLHIRSNAQSWFRTGLISEESQRSIENQFKDEEPVRQSQQVPRSVHEEHPRFRGLTQKELAADNAFGLTIGLKTGQFYGDNEAARKRFYELKKTPANQELLDLTWDYLKRYVLEVFEVDPTEVTEVPAELKRFLSEKQGSGIYHAYTKWENPNQFDRQTLQFFVELPSGRAKFAVFQPGPIHDACPPFAYSGDVFVANPHVVSENGGLQFHYDGGNNDLTIGEITSIITR